MKLPPEFEGAKRSENSAEVYDVLETAIRSLRQAIESDPKHRPETVADVAPMMQSMVVSAQYTFGRILAGHPVESKDIVGSTIEYCALFCYLDIRDKWPADASGRAFTNELFARMEAQVRKGIVVDLRDLTG